MSANTKIEWCDHTFNPWTGCMKVSPGCDGCYAEAWSKRAGAKVGKWGPGAPRVRTSAANWKQPLKWEANAQAFQAEHGRRQRVFCASLADVFDNEAPAEWRMDLFSLIADTPNLDWLLLTKRIGNVLPMCSADSLMLDMISQRVWLGATVVNQEEVDRDIPKLLKVPAHKRFLSMEPLLGPITFRWASWVDHKEMHQAYGCVDELDGLLGIDWIIIGGESGPNARPMHPDWARKIRDQCHKAEVPFLLKQWGEWATGVDVDILHAGNKEGLMRGGKHICITPAGKPPTHGESAHMLERLGKKAAGRELDGVTHDGSPA